MKIKIVYTVIFLFLACQGSVAKAHTFVGNGGDGIVIGDRVYLRDLYALGSHLNPKIGHDIDPAYTRSKSPLLNFPHPEKRLLQKLTDINAHVPGLGDVLFFVIQKFNWALIDSALTPLPDSSDAIVLPDDASIAQIANRFLMNIRINQTLWEKLDDPNKVALIIHEAISSLLRPTCVSKVRCEQSSYIAREITGSLFAQVPSPFLADRILPLLALSADALTVQDTRPPYTWSFSNGVNQTSVSATEGRGALKRRLDEICAEADQMVKISPVALHSQLVRRTLKLSIQNFPAGNFSDARIQQSIDVDRLPEIKNRDVIAKTPGECQKFLREDFETAAKEPSLLVR